MVAWQRAAGCARGLHITTRLHHTPTPVSCWCLQRRVREKNTYFPHLAPIAFSAALTNKAFSWTLRCSPATLPVIVCLCLYFLAPCLSPTRRAACHFARTARAAFRAGGAGIQRQGTIASVFLHISLIYLNISHSYLLLYADVGVRILKRGPAAAARAQASPLDMPAVAVDDGARRSSLPRHTCGGSGASP